ncbi:MAG: hypothetical protein KC613_15970 [Myxococcales bacterium]|nr:hypothetical protein [Myxococcales bacterium]MCB9523891.1 hypothetical protein [Myxococcales bacterium]
MGRVRYWLVALLVLSGCSYLKDATESECQAAIDQRIKLEGKSIGGSGALGRGAELLGQGLTRISGDRGDAIRNCMAKYSSAKARCMAGADSLSRLERCK